MPVKRLLIANRGEIAIRIARTAADMAIHTVAIHPADDANSLHTRKTDSARTIPGTGVAAYLDIDAIVAAAKEEGCDAVHPGYGFLAENAAFARACQAAGLTFVGPEPETLDLFGDKARARVLAERCGVPVVAGTSGTTTLEEARAFLDSLGTGGAVMLKAIAGGGGRGMRPVHNAGDLAAVFDRCASEATTAFGDGRLYVEQLFPRARHIEVQVVGDGSGAVRHLWERECSLQRQRQKLVEIAPAPGLDLPLRDKLLDAALGLAKAAKLKGLATVEFLVSIDAADTPFAFIEVNPRLQVEHTVTEAVTDIDLVRLQLLIAGGARLRDVGLPAKLPAPRGMAVQLRINMETLGRDGNVKPGGGTITAYEPPAGPGIRLDAYGYAGYRTSPRFDSLLAKLIVHAPSGCFEDVAGKAYRALCEFRIAGVPTNIAFLQALLRHDEVRAGRTHTRFVEETLGQLLAPEAGKHQRLYVEPATAARRAGAKVDAGDPLAVLAHGRNGAGSDNGAALVDEPAPAVALDIVGPETTVPILAPMQGTVVSLNARPGDMLRAGQPLLVMEAMKMEHVIEATSSGIVREITVAKGDTVFEGHPLAFIEEAEVAVSATDSEEEVDLDAIRPDLAEVLDRRGKTRDTARPDAVARRRKTGQRTVRENIGRLCDPDSFVEYGALVVAARRQRNTLEELIRTTPADGLVMGVGRVNGSLYPDRDARAVVMHYDYTVLAGTQGKKNHAKKDRMFQIARDWRLPVVFFTEGGGGRPGDTDVVFAANLITPAFHMFGKLSGLVPLVGITSGRCFAGNAVMLGCCDVVIATKNSTIGMGGPAMIEGGGLGVFRPEEVGPMPVMTRNGVVDIAVEDEDDAVDAAKKYLSYFQGPVADWTCADQRKLRRAIPENRLRVYDVRKVIDLIADTGSVLELRRHFGVGMVTALIRIEGRPGGLIANNPMHLGGAIDSEAADKAARFMQLCDAFDLPILSLCDTPGNMVGPEHEKTGLVRHCCRPFVIGANLTVPLFVVVLRKAYGLGAQGMAGGGFHAPFFAISWPTGEFGGMGLEGAIKLGYRNELAAIADPEERRRTYEKMVAGMYEKGKALSAATLFDLDDVIDPAETRKWLMAGLRSAPPVAPRSGKKHAWIDTW